MSKRKWIAVAVAVAVGLIAVGGLVWALAGDSDEPEVAGETMTAGNPIVPAPPPPSVPPPGNDGAPTAGEDPKTESSVANDSNADASDVQSRDFRAPVRCQSGGEPTAAPLPGDSARDGKRWVTAQRLDGSCDLSSDVFSLRGADTRIAWRSDATNFVAFIVDANEPDAAAGFADAECAGGCSEYQSITAKNGDYNLRVQADGGPWEIVVQEYR